MCVQIMKKLQFFFLVLCSLCSFKIHAASLTLEDLDSILQGFPSIHEFLASIEAQEAYFKAAQQYYGGEQHFPKESYEAILQSFAKVLEQVPELAERAWTVRPVREPIVFEHFVRITNFSLTDSKWREFLKSLGFSPAGVNEVPELEALLGGLKTLEAEIHQIEKENESLSVRAKARVRAEKIQLLKSSSRIHELRKLWFMHLNSRHELQEVLFSPSYETGLFYLERIRTQPQEWLPEGNDLRRALQMLSDAIPPASTIVHGLSPGSNVEIKKIKFIDVPRRFHAIFRGMKECVGGWKKYLYMLTPRRFLIPLLSGGHEIQVLENGIYNGHISTVAIENERHERWLSLDIMSTSLSKKGVLIDIGHKREHSGSVFSLWLQQEVDRLPKEVQGYAVGQTNAINNAQGKTAIVSSPDWLRSHPIGAAETFRTSDLMEARIIAASRVPELLPLNYRVERMIYESSVQNAGMLVQLNPSDNRQEENILRVSWDQIERSKGLVAQSMIWAHIGEAGVPLNAHAALFREATQALAYIHGTPIRDLKAVATASSLKGLLHILSYRIAGTVEDFYDQFLGLAHWSLALGEYQPAMDVFFEKHGANGIRLILSNASSSEQGPSQQIAKLMSFFKHNTETQKQILQEALTQVKNAPDFLALLEMSPQEKKAFQVVIEVRAKMDDFVDQFLRLRPSLEELLRFMPYVRHALKRQQLQDRFAKISRILLEKIQRETSLNLNNEIFRKDNLKLLLNRMKPADEIPNNLSLTKFILTNNCNQLLSRI